MTLATTEAPSTVTYTEKPSRPLPEPARPPGHLAIWRACSDTSQEQIDGDIPVARATLQLVAAYRQLHEVAPQTLPPSAAPSFRTVCDSLCSTLVAMDDLTAILWGESA
jgi:hypothetical protein